MKLIVFLCLLVGTALASAAAPNHANVTVYSLREVREDFKYPYYPPGPHLHELNARPFVFVYPVSGSSGRLSALYVENGFQGMSKYHDYVQAMHQGNKYLVLAYPWQLPRDVLDRISALDIVASASHGPVAIPQLPYLAAAVSSRPIVLLQGRTDKNQLIREEELQEAGTVRVTPEGDTQVVRDLVAERYHASRFGPFYNPYGFAFQGFNTGYPFNYGYEFPGHFPSYGFQAQYPGFGYQGPYAFQPQYGFFQGQYPRSTFEPQYPYYAFQSQYPYYAFQSQYPYYGFQSQYPSYGQYPRSASQPQYPFQAQHPSFPSYAFQSQYPHYGFQGLYYNYDPVAKHQVFQSPAFPGYDNCYQGYSGFFPSHYLYPGIFGNPSGYNFFPNQYYPISYPGYPFFFYGQQKEKQEQAKEYPGYQYGAYPPFAFYAQQPQNQYQGYPYNYQSYPYSKPEPKAYQYQQYPYNFQEYQFNQYQPHQFYPNQFNFQQYQPYDFQQYQPYHYQPYHGQYYPQ